MNFFKTLVRNHGNGRLFLISAFSNQIFVLQRPKKRKCRSNLME